MDVHCSLVSYGRNKQISQQFWRSLLLFLSESRHIIHIWSSETTVFNHFSVICSMILIMQFYFRFRFIVLFLFIWFLWDCHSSVFFIFTIFSPLHSMLRCMEYEFPLFVVLRLCHWSIFYQISNFIVRKPLAFLIYFQQNHCTNSRQSHSTHHRSVKTTFTSIRVFSITSVKPLIKENREGGLWVYWLWALHWL